MRHPRLCSDAKVLILYVQGLPDGCTDLALSEHARKLGIKGHASHGLRLGVAEARSLLAQTVEWLRRGVPGGELRRVLSSNLPQDGVRCAVGFLRHRLEQKMPEAVVSVPDAEPARPPSDPPPPPAVPPYVAPLVTCAGPGTEHVFRAMAEETECPDCQQAAAWARWAERRAADLGVDLADDAAAAVEAGRAPDGWRGRLAAAAAAAGVPGGPGAP